ncbi:hypothetical protein [Mesorhizobium sp. WSM4312]|uniref:hypothetical protein n=1 Tax=Mesorhizobium sp. WSM4312 TaxID=2029411 RepID=UPI000BAFE193|nr:hypothetical protein [Mesorhizobium sp. WSM4312]
MADTNEGATGPTDTPPNPFEGITGPAGPTEVAPKAAPKAKAKEPKLPANHEVLLSGNVLVTL